MSEAINHAEVIRDLIECYRAWEPGVRILGNVRAGDAAEALDALQTQLEEARGESTAALRLVARIREALGDNGRRMQDELIEYCRQLAARDCSPRDC